MCQLHNYYLLFNASVSKQAVSLSRFTIHLVHLGYLVDNSHVHFNSPQSPPKGITVPYRPLKPVTTAVAGLGVAGQGNPVVSQSAAAAAAAAVAAAATSQANYLSGSANGHQAAAAAAAALNNPSAAAALLPGNQVGDARICYFLFRFSVPSQGRHNPLPTVAIEYPHMHLQQQQQQQQ